MTAKQSEQSDDRPQEPVDRAETQDDSSSEKRRRPASSQRLSHSPSVFAEPWMQPVRHAADPRDPGQVRPVPENQPEDQFVYDEPALSAELVGGIPDDARTWFRWYQQQAARTGPWSGWLVTLGVILSGGLLAVAGTFMAQELTWVPLLNLVVFGPTAEEIMKVVVVLWIVEKRPWLFRSPVQILLCALASGAAFAAIENVLYLTVYIPNPPPELVRWRWTVCVLLHTGCSFIAGIGAVRVWTRFQSQRRAPVLSDGAAWITAAIVMHGLYNGTMVLLEQTVLEF